MSNSNYSVDSLLLTQEVKKRLLSYNSIMKDEDVHINVELVDNVVTRLNKGKTAGIDRLTAEHFQFCHPVVISILSMLFNLMLKYECVPNAFGIGIIIPIPKKDSNCNYDKHSDFRGITISPVVSKIFELCILKNIKDLLSTSDLQFGFKSGLGCNHAIYSVRSVVNHFTLNNSTVNLCALDVAKAFDQVNHSILFNKLMNRNLPRCIVSVLCKWYENSFAVVRWNSCLSSLVKISAGVRQGGVLSPYLFAVFVDDILNKLKLSGLGCRVNQAMFNAIMYADDLLLMSASLCDLQSMVNLCVNEFRSIGLSININKSVCMRIGPRYKVPVTSIAVDDSFLQWKSELRFLGVTLLAASSIRCNLQVVRQSYFRALNGIFGKIGTHSTELVTLSLINSFCIPILTYGIEAFNVSVSMYNVLESAFSAAFSKIFGTFDKSIIKQCQFYSHISPLCNVIDGKRLKFLHGVKSSSNFALKLLFETTGKNEYICLLKKHSITTDNVNQFKSILWQNFSSSLAM